ncbi:hypothetical protein [Priestia aryabhattai]|uniref:hypothetical protein n=1 Tax=Priestia aryabhattai TaxID=412384 RepID=UPI0015F58E76|nr:hypothetical protein [Priestia aryabhattai]
MSRSELKKSKKRSIKSKLIILSVSLITIVSLAFTIYVLNGLLSTKELLTSKPKTIHTEQTEKPNHYANELEKESKLKEEMEKVAVKEESKQDEKEQLYKDYETYQNAAKEEESYSYTYTITSMNGSEYYAESEKDMYGSVYFTQDNIKSGEEFQINDVVVVSFVNDDTITDVQLLFNGSEYEEEQQEQTEAEIQNDKAFEELEKKTEELKKEVNENYEAVTGNKDTSYNVKEVIIESVDGGEYTATNGVTFTSDQVYNGIEFEEGDNATVIYDENGNLFEVNDGIMSEEMILAEDGHYVSPSFYN